MSQEPTTITLPFPVQTGQVLLLALGIIVMSGLIYAVLRGQERKPATEFSAHSFLNIFAVALTPIWLFLFSHVLWSLWHLSAQFDPTKQDADLRWHILAFIGLITALGGLISTPLALIRVWTTERQTRTAEQGHITDRISKAVEQLGAEKTVKTLNHDGETVETTVPNIEVRIGGLLSLERIAQDSTAYDKGRDHVRVMEILCAYVRENSNAQDAKDSLRYRYEVEVFGGDYIDGEVTPQQTAQEFMDTHKLDDVSLSEKTTVCAQSRWAQSLPKPRTDIQQALDIIGRRDTAKPEDTVKLEKAANYTLDLRGSNLQAADMADGNWSHARLQAARMEGANLYGARMQGANLRGARMEGAILSAARMQGANLYWARMEGAQLFGARMEGAILDGARMEGAILGGARMEGADLSEARMEGALLTEARMEGANLRGARMDASTELTSAVLRGAAVSWVDDTTITQLEPHLDDMFGDGSVDLPEGIPRPAHWPKWTLPWRGAHGFADEWRKWRDDPDGYPPPPNPEE